MDCATRLAWHPGAPGRGPNQLPLTLLCADQCDTRAIGSEPERGPEPLGPALLLRHFSPLLDRQRAVLAMLSAKVGSIGDNRLGGWYSYRASKAALNMLLATAAIELRRSQPHTVVVALHPGTVSTGLSAPFRGGEIGRPADLATAQMLATLDGLTPADSGAFVAYDGQRLPW